MEIPEEQRGERLTSQVSVACQFHFPDREKDPDGLEREDRWRVLLVGEDCEDGRWSEGQELKVECRTPLHIFWRSSWLSPWTGSVGSRQQQQQQQ
jgi:hypothetical protein